MGFTKSTLTDFREIQKQTNKQQVSWGDSQEDSQGDLEGPFNILGFTRNPQEKAPDSLRQKEHIWNYVL